jgi:MYXO-CTERM domain-containing protein
LALAVCLFASASARAEFIDFSYEWTAEPSEIVSGSGKVTISTAPGSASHEVGGLATNIHGADVSTTSTTPEPGDLFDTTFNMKLKITDTASGQSGFLTFAGSLMGKLTSTSSQLNSEFTTNVTQQLKLGNHKYTVTIDPTLVALPSPGSDTAAVIDARVSVVNETPEPSSLMLGALALAGLGLRAGVRRRKS